MFSTQKRAAALLIAGAAATGALAMAPAASAAPSGHAAGGGAAKRSATLWATDVNAHRTPYVSSAVSARHLRGTVPVTCQKKGGNVSYDTYRNNWWVSVPGKGWVSAVFFKGGANGKPVPGIRGC